MAKKIKLDLSQFKASGVYTLEFDASENIILTSQTIRLVVGFSKKGPFNTPVYIPDMKTALAVFGDIDRTLENQGSYFHRSIQVCLSAGPVFALNLLKLNNNIESYDSDKVSYKSFSIDTEEHNGTMKDKLYASFFNKERFWFADPEYFLATLDPVDSGKLFNLVNLGKEAMSIIVRKSTDANKPILGYNIFAVDWYGADRIPSYVHPYDYISDYFIDVIAVAGDWTDYETLSLDPKWNKFFTPNGFIKSQIDNFLAHSDIDIISMVTGSVLPGFVDLNGNNQYIETLINNQTVQTGIFCAIDEKGIENICNNDSRIDLVGHHLIDELTSDADMVEPRLNFLSYEQALTSDYTYIENLNILNTGDINIPELELGTLFNYTGNINESGIEDSYFKVYDNTLYDNGCHYIETIEVGGSGALTGDQMKELKSFLEIKSNSDQPYLIGKILADPNGVLPPEFIVDELIKLKIVSVKEVNQSLRILYKHPLDTKTFRDEKLEIIPYITSGISGPVLNGAYVFGKNDMSLIKDIYSPTGATGAGPGPNTGPEFKTLIGYPLTDLYNDVSKGEINNSDKIWTLANGGEEEFIKATKEKDKDGFDLVYIRSYSDPNLYDGIPNEDPTNQIDVADWNTTFKSTSTVPLTDNSNLLNIISNKGSISDTIGNITKIDAVSFLVNTSENKISVGDLIVSTDKDLCSDPDKNQQNRLTKVISVSKTTTNDIVKVTTARPIEYFQTGSMYVKRFKTIEEFTNSFKFTYLKGFTLKESHKPNGSDSRVSEILDVLYNTNIASTLSSKDVISFRYIVDTFSGQILPNSKYQLSKLAKDRQKALAIINAPSMNQFRNSVDPRFTDAKTDVDPYPSLNAKYIADGGNLSLNPSYTFTLPTEEQGSKFCGFYAPHIVIRENNKNIKVPPAAFVSNNYVRKFSNGEPYAIVAGKKRGVISGAAIVGLEYDFSDEDRGYLEPFGINPIIQKSGLGPVIFANNTAFQQVNTAFNLLHVRDVLISIENDVEEILSNYLFDFNEDSIRLEIKTLVDNYLDGVRAGGGIYTFQTTMDGSNNTSEIIDRNMGIIDIIVEPARGIHRFINRITVTRTGGIASGGFIDFV